MNADLAKGLSEIVSAGNNVFLYTKPEILDFTNSEIKNEITVCGMGGNEVNFIINDKNIYSIASLLKNSIFSNGIKLIGWNLKSLFSFFKFKTGRDFTTEGNPVDLKVIEAYLGIKGEQPKNLIEALNRLKHLVVKGLWKPIQDVYQKIHVPLIKTVIPQLETIGILNTELGKKVHGCYEIFGQKNGRLKCNLGFNSGFVPHTLGDEIKKVLKPNALEDIFMYFDYKNMEVSMLHWLSKDKVLGEYLAKPDFYLEIFEAITGNPHNSDKNNRILAKKLFLPIIYGQSAQSLGIGLKVSVETAEKIVSRIKTLFHEAVEYVSKYREFATANGYCEDMFGKRRYFDEDKSYEALNFSVQSPASLACLEKLIDLNKVIDIAYSVHDGYCVYSDKKNYKQIYKTCYDVLTSDSRLFPGLKLNVTCQAGRSLDSLKSPFKKG